MDPTQTLLLLERVLSVYSDQGLVSDLKNLESCLRVQFQGHTRQRSASYNRETPRYDGRGFGGVVGKMKGVFEAYGDVFCVDGYFSGYGGVFENVSMFFWG